MSEWLPVARTVFDQIVDDYVLSDMGIHGLPHWARVMENGRRLAAESGADPLVVDLFALFHDARRINEGRDPGHGTRGAELAKQLRSSLPRLTDNQFDLLYEACAHHTDRRTSPNPTIGVCWDADRLDLWRVGITPDENLLSTATARALRTLSWAQPRSTDAVVPSFVTSVWMDRRIDRTPPDVEPLDFLGRKQRGKLYQEERILLTKYGEWDGETESTGDMSKVEGPGFVLTDGTITERAASHVVMAAEAIGAMTKDYQTLLAFLTRTGAIRLPSPFYGAATGPLNLHVEARPTTDQVRQIDALANRATQIVIDYRNQSKTFELWEDAMRFFRTLPESTHAENGLERS